MLHRWLAPAGIWSSGLPAECLGEGESADARLLAAPGKLAPTTRNNARVFAAAVERFGSLFVPFVGQVATEVHFNRPPATEAPAQPAATMRSPSEASSSDDDDPPAPPDAWRLALSHLRRCFCLVELVVTVMVAGLAGLGLSTSWAGCIGGGLVSLVAVAIVGVLLLQLRPYARPLLNVLLAGIAGLECASLLLACIAAGIPPDGGGAGAGAAFFAVLAAVLLFVLGLCDLAWIGLRRVLFRTVDDADPGAVIGASVTSDIAVAAARLQRRPQFGVPGYEPEVVVSPVLTDAEETVTELQRVSGQDKSAPSAAGSERSKSQDSAVGAGPLAARHYPAPDRYLVPAHLLGIQPMPPVKDAPSSHVSEPDDSNDGAPWPVVDPAFKNPQPAEGAGPNSSRSHSVVAMPSVPLADGETAVAASRLRDTGAQRVMPLYGENSEAANSQSPYASALLTPPRASNPLSGSALPRRPFASALDFTSFQSLAPGVATSKLIDPRTVVAGSPYMLTSNAGAAAMRASSQSRSPQDHAGSARARSWDVICGLDSGPSGPWSVPRRLRDADAL